jgi:hypothetical protein
MVLGNNPLECWSTGVLEHWERHLRANPGGQKDFHTPPEFPNQIYRAFNHRALLSETQIIPLGQKNTQYSSTPILQHPRNKRFEENTI